jgi:NTE family protein
MNRLNTAFITLLILLLSVMPARARQTLGSSQSLSFCEDGGRLALVLGGGGAKGAAHVGVLKVLEEAGVRPDIVVGTSIGAIVGGLYSIGYTSSQLDSLFSSRQWLQLFTREAIRGNAIKAMLDSLVQTSARQSQTLNSISAGLDGRKWPLFACVASDLPSFSEVVLTGDSLARNMRASMAIPALFKAVRFDDYVLYDGGVFNNLPVDVARQMGATRVIAIDLTVNHPDEEDDEESPSELKQILDELFNLSDAKGIVGWLFNRPDFKKYRKNCKDADVYINPPLYDYDAADFSRQAVINMIGIGEKAARQKIESLRNCKP